MLYVTLFIFGLFTGSFINLIADRLVSSESFLFGRSHCDFCKHKLSIKDLLPIISFGLLKGRCRYCNEKLSIYYPLSEFLTGMAFFGIAYYLKFETFPTWQLPMWLRFIYLLVITSMFIIILLTDAKYRIIPDKVLIPAVVLTLGYLVFVNAYYLTNLRSFLANDKFGVFMLQVGYFTDQLVTVLKNIGTLLLSSLAISLFFLFLIFITKGRGMGYGDVKLGFLIGLFNGFPHNLLAIFLGFLVGSVYSLFLIAMGKKSMKDTIPFGPFLITGSFITFFAGEFILNWYLNIF